MARKQKASAGARTMAEEGNVWEESVEREAVLNLGILTGVKNAVFGGAAGVER
jgi:hypothetical protein